jgi:ribonucleoside-diphosphate reductase beta chain
MSLTAKSIAYRPMKYEWAYQACIQQQKMHWLPAEVNLADDIKDYRTNLTTSEKALLDNILCFFTQADIDVAGAYHDIYIPHFQNNEVRMMLSTFAAMEAVHIDAYAKVVDTLGMGDKTFTAFMEYKEMRDKHDFLLQFNASKPWEVAKSIAAFSGFGEGLQLFASFAMLLNFSRFNKMKGMGQIVTWSIRDESLHVESLMRLFHEYCAEHEGIIDKRLLEKDIRNICNSMISIEDKFIELSFSEGPIKGLDKESIMCYIRYVAGVRLKQLGYTHDLPTENPLAWMNEMLALPEHTNFFENTPTEYSKGSTTGAWDLWD